MTRVSVRKIKMVNLGWQQTVRTIPLLVKGRTKYVTVTRWFHPLEHKLPISFSQAFAIQFPTLAPPKLDF